MTANTDQPTVQLELCVRSLASPNDLARQEELFDSLEALLEADQITSFDATVWGDRLPLDRSPRTDTGRRLCRLVGRFEQWADQPGRTINPFFETREMDCELLDSDRDCRVLSLPEFALAEFHDGNLVWLSPHRENNSTHTVDDHLDAIASTDPRHDSLDATETAVPPDRSEVPGSRSP